MEPVVDRHKARLSNLRQPTETDTAGTRQGGSQPG